jgi:hypothetical protein
VDTSAEAVKEHMESLEAGTQNSLSRSKDDAKENPGNPMPSSMTGSYPTVTWSQTSISSSSLRNLALRKKT